MSDSPEAIAQTKLATRGRGKLLALFLATLITAYLCFLLVLPFLPAAVWAVTLAVVTRRYRDQLASKIKNHSVVAGIGVTVVTFLLLLPVVFVGVVAGQQLRDFLDRWDKAWVEASKGGDVTDDPILEPEAEQRGKAQDGKRQPNPAAKMLQDSAIWKWVKDHPRIQDFLDDAWKQFKRADKVPQILNQLRIGVTAAVTGPLAVVIQMLLMMFFLFYLYRDEEAAVAGFKHLLPLNEREAKELCARLIDTIDATIYGKFVVALMQGSLMAVMFWFVGISGAVLWGAIMTLLAVIPYLGAFVIWAPAAGYLALQGEWGRAALLTGWGTIVVGTIDNLVYPMLVRDQLRQHTSIALVGILGGIVVFGFTGIVLGPVTITLMLFLLDVWRRRTDHGRAAERA